MPVRFKVSWGLGVWWRGARFGLTEAPGLESVQGPRMLRPVVQSGGAGVGEFYEVILGAPGAETEGGHLTVGRKAAFSVGHPWSL